MKINETHGENNSNKLKNQRMKKLIFGAIFLLACMSMSALEITRYVSPIGTGDGMTPENPTADLGAMLELGAKVDCLYLYVAPGFYHLDFDSDAGGVTFKNIILDGSWNDESTSDMVHIDYHAVTFVNSVLYKVSFSGSAAIEGGSMISCKSEEGRLGAVLRSGDCYFKSCLCKGFFAENWAVGSNNDDVIMEECFAGDGLYGFKGEHLNGLYVTDSLFCNSSEDGCCFDCKYGCFTNCAFDTNKGYGAVSIGWGSDASIVYFDRCRFISNEVTYKTGNIVNIACQVNFNNCLFADNIDRNADSHGIVSLMRPDFYFINCTFIDNTGGISIQQFDPTSYQIINCAFWNNGKNNIYAGGREDVPLLSCAMDHGTGIPELDAEKGIITLTEANKGFRFTDTEIEIDPSSILVNRGHTQPVEGTDLYWHPRTAFGATDIGCREFFSTPGLWKPESTQITVEAGTYTICKAIVNGENYYCMLPTEMAKADEVDINSYDSDLIYLDKMPVAPKVLEGKYIERHMADTNGGFLVDVMYKDDYERWRVADTDHYSSAKDRPTVKIVDNQVKFVMPTTTNKPATANKPTASKAGTAKKHPATKSQKSSQKSSKTNYWKR